MVAARDAGTAALRERFGGLTAPTGSITFLPEPDPQPRWWPLISVDDHVIEPPHVFEGRLPAHLQDAAPRVVELDDGSQDWLYGGELQHQLGLGAVVGRPLEEAFDPTRFEHMRRGAWEPAARVHDMDLAGVYASLNFPSGLGGFAGQRLQLGRHEPELALAVVRAWNDWYLEEWVTPQPDRFIACQIPYLRDPEVAADEVRRNAARGFRAVSFTEGPHHLGLPSLHTGHWEPFVTACEETGTVVCLHVGSASTHPQTAPDAPFDTVGVLFFAYAMSYVVDWLYSLIPLRHPELRICMSEGGIGWVPGLLDRLDHVGRYDRIYGTWPSSSPSPSDVLRRNFWFCTIDDPTTFRVLDRIGTDHVMVECDYPHLDSLWPHTQAVLREQLAVLDAAAAAEVAWANAASLFRHPVPAEIVADPTRFGGSAYDTMGAR